MCSWCWGYRPISDKLFASLPDNIQRVNILGGLAADSDAAMPQDLRVAIAAHWHKIHDMLGTEFNFSFWDNCEPRRSTYPACRAVIAAARQGQEAAMNDAIQRAYYLQAMNPSDKATLEALALQIGLERQQFVEDIDSEELEKELQRQIDFARQSPISGFPSLALKINDTLHPLRLDYQSCGPTLQHLEELSANTR